MPLIFTGEQFTSSDFEFVFPAEDTGTGSRISVLVSQEAVDDNGEAAVKDKASDKYDLTGKPSKVTITTSDFA